MTIPTSVLTMMATLGLSAEQAKGVATMLSDVEAATRDEATADIEAGREKARERWHRWKNKQETNASKRLPTTANNSRSPDARVEDKTSNSDIEPQEKNKTKGDAAGFVDALRAVLDDERLDALVKHRRSRKAPVTALAAKLFIEAAGECRITVAEATDHCISRNWLTVKPDWIAKNAPRGSPSNRPPTAQEILKARRQVNSDDDQPPNRPLLVASR